MTESPEKTLQLQAATLEWIDRFAPYGVIITDRDLQIQNWNHWMEHHSGLTKAAVLGRKLIDLYPELENRRFIGQFERALKGEVSVVSTALHGHLIPLPPVSRDTGQLFMKQTARIAPLITGNEIHGILIVIEDVTQREWQAEILSRQQARDEMLAWALAQLMRADDPRRIIREVFCKVAEHLDFDAYLLHLYDPASAIFELHASGGIEPESEHLVRAVPAAILPWMPHIKERRAIVRERVQSSTEPVLENARKLGFRAHVVLPLMVEDTLIGLLTFATRTRDVIAPNETDLLTTISQYLGIALNREKVGRELRAAQEKLNQHAQELEKRVAERTASLKQIIAELQTFSYTIAHDLRAPIRALKGYCEVLIEDFADHLPDDGISILNRLRDASVHMDDLTRDLLEFSKVSRQDLTLAPTDLSQVVTEAVSLGGARFSAAAQIELPLLPVFANRTLVAQCVSNLLQNAIKFCRPGIPPRVRIWSELASRTDGSIEAPASFTPSLRSLNSDRIPPLPQSERRVRLWFEDNGTGISPEAQRKIFGIFERGDRAGEYEGTGIGLAIVARAMERMDGSCGVESELDQGSRFWLEFNAPPLPEPEGIPAGEK